MITPHPQGIITPLITPYRTDGTVDHKAAASLLEFQAEHHVDGVFLLGTTGEGILLSPPERRDFADALLGERRSSMRTILHCGAPDSDTAVGLARHAAALGVDAISAMPPLLFNYDADSLRTHYSQVALAAPESDLFAYDNPAAFGYTLGPELVLRLFREIPTLRGLKDSGDSLARVCAYLAAPDDIEVYTGHNVLLLGSLVMGAAGGVASLANVVPELHVGVVSAFRSGLLEEARRKQLLIARLQGLLAGLPYIAGLKRLMEWRGLPSGQPRLPLPQATDDLEALLRKRITTVPELDTWLQPVG